MLRNRRVNVLYYPPISYDSDGLAIESEPISSFIFASEQPATADDLERLPEGADNKDVKVFFTNTFLSSGSVKNATRPNVVISDGKKYEVVAVSIWANGIISHSRSVCIRRDE